jgi:uncharacterized membrane protein HdeD (DUF308 family)
MRIPLIAASAAAAVLWGVAIAGLAAAAAASLTVISGTAWLMFGVANMMRDRDKELLIDGMVAEARKRAGTGGLRRVQ